MRQIIKGSLMQFAHLSLPGSEKEGFLRHPATNELVGYLPCALVWVQGPDCKPPLPPFFYSVDSEEDALLLLDNLPLKAFLANAPSIKIGWEESSKLIFMLTDNEMGNITYFSVPTAISGVREAFSKGWLGSEFLIKNHRGALHVERDGEVGEGKKLDHYVAWLAFAVKSKGQEACSVATNHKKEANELT